VIGVVKHTTATTAYFRCVLLDQRMQESLCRAKFLSALPRPPAGPPASEEPEGSELSDYGTIVAEADSYLRLDSDLSATRPNRQVFHSERIASRWRPAFSFHLINASALSEARFHESVKLGEVLFARSIEPFDNPLCRARRNRHTFATRQLHAGVPIAVVSKLLGHSSISTTLNIYAHVLAEHLEQFESQRAKVLGISGTYRAPEALKLWNLQKSGK
jgi:hypothetical protein